MYICSDTHGLCAFEFGVMNVINFTGRGLKSGENFELLYNLAEKFNAAGEKIARELEIL